MRSRTVLGVAHGDDGFKGAHRTMAKRDLCIMACVFCRDPLFLKWLSARAGGAVDEAGAKAYITTACGVASRSDLDKDPAAAERFHQLVRIPFLEWKQQAENQS